MSERTIIKTGCRVKRFKLAAGTVLLFVVAAAVSLGACEVFLRVFGPLWLKETVRELQLGKVFGSDANWPVDRMNGKFYRFKPGAEFRQTHTEYSTDVHIDKWGGRMTPYRTGRRIAWTGDSFTFGVGVNDSATFVALTCAA